MLLSVLLAALLGVSQSLFALDIGLRDSAKNLSRVIYADGDNVFLRTCEPPIARPTRDCPSKIEEVSVSKQLFLKTLDLNTGYYDIDKDGLSLAKSDLQAAQTAAESGNSAAETEAKRLRDVVANIERLLEIAVELEEGVHSMHYQFEADYKFLIKGFGSAAVTTWVDEVSQQSFIVLNGVMSQENAAAACGNLPGNFRLPTVAELQEGQLYKRIKDQLGTYMEKLQTLGGAEFYGIWTQDRHTNSEECYSSDNHVCGHVFRIRITTGPLCGNDEAGTLPFCKYNNSPTGSYSVICLNSDN